MMATLRVDHPDIEAFIEAKREPGRLRMFNLSVLATDAFMQAVAEDQPWQLSFGGPGETKTVAKVLPARELWDKIMRATYAYAEPGVIFIDRINRRNNLWYCEEIQATNPCLTADTWIQTSDGPRQIAELVGRPFAAIADGATWRSDPCGFVSTGSKPTVSLRTAEGYALRLTPDHRLRRITRRTRWSTEWEWCAASELRPGSELLLHDHRNAPAWGDPEAADRDAAEGYLLGLLIGDGTLKRDKAVLSVWPDSALLTEQPSGRHGGHHATPALGAASVTASHGFPRMDRGSRPRRVSPVARRAEASGRSARTAPAREHITPAIERRSSAFHRAFLRGLFDADGSVQGTQAKGVSVRLSQSNRDDLLAVQRMLLRLGIASTIYSDRRDAGPRELPDGQGGAKLYFDSGAARTGRRKRQSVGIRGTGRLRGS